MLLEVCCFHEDVFDIYQVSTSLSRAPLSPNSRCSNFDNSVQRVRFWSTDRPIAPSPSLGLTPSSSTVQLVGLGLASSAPSGPGAVSDPSSPNNTAYLTSGQRRRIKQFLKRCRMNPRHSQLNMEGYLLLPVQRIPRYRLLVSIRAGLYMMHLIHHLPSWKSFCVALHRHILFWMIHWTEPWQKYLLWPVT
jgi:hypothetical protein